MSRYEEHETTAAQPKQTQPKEIIGQRSKRSVALQTLYAIDSFDYEVTIDAIIGDFNRHYQVDISEGSMVRNLLNGTINHRQELDTKFLPLIENWEPHRIDKITKLILRMAIWEALYCEKKIASEIIIFEYIELAKAYGEKDTYKFINGILDRILHPKKDRKVK